MPAVLLATAFVLHYLSIGAGVLLPSHVVGPLAVVISLSAALVALLAWRLGGRRRAALLATLLVLGAGSAAPFLAAFEALAALGLPDGAALVSATCLLAGAWMGAAMLLARLADDAPGVRRLWDFSLAAAAYLVVSGLVACVYTGASTSPVPGRTLTQDPAGSLPESPPDVYWILLDAYSRQDVLKAEFDLDNRPFLEALRARGFHVATEASSNYATTPPSMASALNWDHLAPDPLREVASWAAYHGTFTGMIRANRTVRFFRALGYHTASYTTGLYAFDGLDVEEQHRTGLGTFDHHLLASSLPGQLTAEWERRDHHAAIAATLDRLGREERGRPRFVFAHVIAPHPPFVLGADGAYQASGFYEYSLMDMGASLNFHLGDGWYQERYRRQVQGLNRLVLASLDRILARSPRAIVLLHGDHGSGSRATSVDIIGDPHERYSILSAVRVPGADPAWLTPTLSPVNYMRLVAGTTFGVTLPRLPDETFFTAMSAGFGMRRIASARLRPRSEAQGQ